MSNMRNVLIALIAVAFSSPALAQRTVSTSNAPLAPGGFWEFGGDVGLAAKLQDPQTLSLSIPRSMLRVAYYVSDVIAIEPAVSFVATTGKGQTGASAYVLKVGLLYHLQSERTSNQTFVRPLISIIGNSFGGGTSRAGLGVGAGMKRPASSGRFAWRSEANLTHYLESGTDKAFTNLNATFGVSVYTR